ncbi:MAG: MurR/RpiR family transcriptional regulator [Rhizobiaceae bacterium]|nr:MurR/RpiR family transcriptional regulator [Rhizobiaceae bacterium]MCV0406845.1 MurR/RpiR family transcriptional regulator [Rhizobiaceae bacterium]
MASSIAERIAERMDELSTGERRAAQALIGDYPMIGLETVADYARRAGVSSPTILRFIGRIGFAAYADFQAGLKEELAEQLQSPLSRSQNQPSAAPGETASPMVRATLDNIAETMRHVGPRQIAEVAEIFSTPRSRLYLVGGRFTDPIARYMAAHLALIRPDVVHLTGQESAWRDRLVDMGRRDALVLFDIRRYQDGLLDVARAAHRRGVRVVLVTDQWLSPIARFATQVLPGRTAVPSPWDSSASLFVLAELIIAETTRALGATGAERIRAIEDTRHEP